MPRVPAGTRPGPGYVAAPVPAGPPHEIAEIHVRPGNHGGEDRCDDAVAGELPEGDRVAGAGGDAEGDDVGAGGDRCAVAAEVGPQGERPPQRLPGPRVGNLGDEPVD